MTTKASKVIIEIADLDDENATLRFKLDPEITNSDEIDVTQPCIQLLYTILESLEDGLQETERVLN